MMCISSVWVFFDAPFFRAWLLVDDVLERLTIFTHGVLLPAVRLTSAVFAHRLLNDMQLLIFDDKHLCTSCFAFCVFTHERPPLSGRLGCFVPVQPR